MGLFSKKKRPEQEVPAPPALGTPTNAVVQMRQQGLSDNQIVQSLQKEGYTSAQVFDALSQADIKKTIQPVQQEAYPEQGEPMPRQGEPMPRQGEPMPRQAPGYPLGYPSGAQPPMPPSQPPAFPSPAPAEPMPRQSEMMPMQAPGVSKDQIEEVAEAIIDEKWEELRKGVDKIIAWKDEADERLIKIEESIDDLKKRFSELHTGVLGKVSEYDKGIRNVGTDIKAMQEVFKKTLPKFTENIAALERMTKKKTVKK